MCQLEHRLSRLREDNGGLTNAAIYITANFSGAAPHQDSSTRFQSPPYQPMVLESLVVWILGGPSLSDASLTSGVALFPVAKIPEPPCRVKHFGLPQTNRHLWPSRRKIRVSQNFREPQIIPDHVQKPVDSLPHFKGYIMDIPSIPF